MLIIHLCLIGFGICLGGSLTALFLLDRLTDNDD